MPDISDINAAQTVKLVGSDSTGVEQTPVESTNLAELKAVDKINQQGEDTTVVLSTTAIEAKVGISTKANRSYVFLQALDNNVKWGFDVNCRFDLFRNQFLSIPASEDCLIYIRASSGTPSVVIGEA